MPSAPHPTTTRCALVTGGGSGIGRAIALALARDGCRVAVAGRRLEPLESTVAEIEALGVVGVAVVGDVADPSKIATVVAAVVERLGDLHLLVNNAGIARGGPIESHAPDEIDAVIDIDLKGPIHAIRAALPHLRRHREARTAAILNISSNVTLSPLSNYSVYSAAKAGVDMLTRCLALELATDRIRVNAISPGVIETPIFDTMMAPADAQAFLASFGAQVPLGRIGAPEDIARIAVALCDPRNDWVTGVVIPVDGGSSLGSP